MQLGSGIEHREAPVNGGVGGVALGGERRHPLRQHLCGGHAVREYSRDSTTLISISAMLSRPPCLGAGRTQAARHGAGARGWEGVVKRGQGWVLRLSCTSRTAGAVGKRSSAR